MKTITILDFCEGEVYEYEIKDSQTEECEDFLMNEGHNPTNCEWMVH